MGDASALDVVEVEDRGPRNRVLQRHPRIGVAPPDQVGFGVDPVQDSGHRLRPFAAAEAPRPARCEPPAQLDGTPVTARVGKNVVAVQNDRLGFVGGRGIGVATEGDQVDVADLGQALDLAGQTEPVAVVAGPRHVFGEHQDARPIHEAARSVGGHGPVRRRRAHVCTARGRVRIGRRWRRCGVGGRCALWSWDGPRPFTTLPVRPEAAVGVPWSGQKDRRSARRAAKRRHG